MERSQRKWELFNACRLLFWRNHIEVTRLLKSKWQIIRHRVELAIVVKDAMIISFNSEVKAPDLKSGQLVAAFPRFLGSPGMKGADIEPGFESGTFVRKCRAGELHGIVKLPAILGDLLAEASPELSLIVDPARARIDFLVV